MMGSGETIETVARVIQVALTPVFLLSGIGSLLGVCSTRLARVADRLDATIEKAESSPAVDRAKLQRRVEFLRKRSHALDVSVILGAIAGASTCLAALLLFVGSLRDEATVTALFVSFGAALICTIGALSAFLAEMLMASRGIRDQVAGIEPELEAAEPPETAHGSDEPGSAAV